MHGQIVSPLPEGYQRRYVVRIGLRMEWRVWGREFECSKVRSWPDSACRREAGVADSVGGDPHLSGLAVPSTVLAQTKSDEAAIRGSGSTERSRTLLLRHPCLSGSSPALRASPGCSLCGVTPHGSVPSAGPSLCN